MASNLLNFLRDSQAQSEMRNALTDAANRGMVAGSLGAPVDMATTLTNLLIAGGGYAGHKMGILSQPPELIDSRNVPGSSEWIGQKMQNAGAVSPNRNALAEFGMGLLSPVAYKGAQKMGGLLYNAETNALANAAKPSTIRGGGGRMSTQYGRVTAASAAPGTKPATAKDLDRASARAALPIEEGGLGLPPGNTREDRMKALGYEAGYWRGGETPANGQPTGPWYTSIQAEAKDYAQRSSAKDVREYALNKSGVLDFGRGYKIAEPLAKKLDADGHTKAAAMLREYYPNNEHVSGMEAYKFLQRMIGEDAPKTYLSAIGFKSVAGVNSPNYRLTLQDAIVRDPKKAAFDPFRAYDNSIYAGVAGAAVLPSLFSEGND